MNKGTVLAMFLAVFTSLAGAQEVTAPVANVTVSPNEKEVSSPTFLQSQLVGRWRGSWSSSRFGSSQMLEIRVIAVKNDVVHGELKYNTSNFPACSTDWEKFVAIKNGEKVSAEVDLKGACGKVITIFWVEKNTMMGTYSAEYPDTGEIRLTKR